MNASTFEAVKSLIKTDGTLGSEERREILNAVKNHGKPAKAETPHIVSRKQVAEILNRSPRSVDMLAAEGVIEKVKMPGRLRACGFRKSDIVSLIEVAK